MISAFFCILSRMSFAAVIIALSSHVLSVEFPYHKLAPRDEASNPPSLSKFLSSLRDVVSRRDVTAFQQLMSENVKVSRGPLFDQSPVDFLQLSDQNSPAWHDLEVLLGIEGRFITLSETLYCKPYIHQAFPEWARESPDYKVVINPDGKFRATPSLHHSPTRNIAYEIVNSGIAQDKDDQISKRWSKVQTFDGEIGYVKKAHLWGQYDPVLCFSKGVDGWAIKIFISSLD